MVAVANPQVDVSRTAMLSMDLQTRIVPIYTRDQPEFVPRVASVIKAARDLGLRVIHVQFGFRPGLPEIDPRNPFLGPIKSSPEWQKVFEGPAGAIHADVAPLSGEIVITKHRVSAFWGTDLEMILRANGIDTLILFGIATSGVVLSTLLDASDADYRLYVVKDCCTDQDADLHSCLVDRLFARRATVLDAADLIRMLGESSG